MIKDEKLQDNSWDLRMRNLENEGIIEIIQEIREMNREKQNETNELIVTGRASHKWDSS